MSLHDAEDIGQQKRKAAAVKKTQSYHRAQVDHAVAQERRRFIVTLQIVVVDVLLLLAVGVVAGFLVSKLVD